jgi:RNA polymerase sigma-70 factor (ECF subfamily)
MGAERLRVIRGGAAEAEPSASAATGDLRELYARYGATVYGRCLYILKDRTKAEDAMHDVFAKALESWGGFRSEASPLTWLVRITTNHCLNVVRGDRAGWRDRFARQESARSEARGGEDAMTDRDLVRRMLGRFDAETCAAAIHYHVDEMTLEEVAAALGRSVPTVRKRLEAFAAACAEELEP